MPLVSIVIPVYNMFHYLRNCMSTVLAQTYVDYEVLLIDDGSTDQSSSLCDKYADGNSGVRVLHKKNGGLASALNVGLDFSFGDYIVFVDCDDYIRNEAIEWMVSAAMRHGVDIAIFELQRGSDKTCIWIKPTGRTDVCSGLELIKNSFIEKTGKSWMLHGKIFAKRCFKKIRFPEGRIYEDNSTVYKMLYTMDKVIVSDDTVYYYFINPNGIVNSSFSIKHLDYLIVLEEMIDFFTQHNESELLEWANRSYLFSLAEMCQKVKANCHSPDVEAELKRKLSKQYEQEKNKYPITMETYPIVIEVLKPTYAKLYWQSRAIKSKLTGK